jgi:hypothetical protein
MLAVFAELAIFGLSFTRKLESPHCPQSCRFVVVLVSLLAWLGGKELSTRVGSISQDARREISGYTQFRSFYTNFFVKRSPQRLRAVAG